VNRPEPPIALGNAFPDSLVSDLIPFIDKTYRTRTDRDSRAIAGLSMGGGHTMWAAFHHLDKFSWVAALSAAYGLIPGVGIPAPPPPASAELRQPGLGQTIDADKLFAALPDLNVQANHRLRLFYMSIGAHDGLVVGQHALNDALAKKGIKSTYIEAPGYIHEWAFWRVALIDLLPRLFQPKA
jgi:enterochelin esterase family protein